MCHEGCCHGAPSFLFVLQPRRESEEREGHTHTQMHNSSLMKNLQCKGEVAAYRGSSMELLLSMQEQPVCVCKCVCVFEGYWSVSLAEI